MIGGKEGNKEINKENMNWMVFRGYLYFLHGSTNLEDQNRISIIIANSYSWLE